MINELRPNHNVDIASKAPVVAQESRSVEELCDGPHEHLAALQAKYEALQRIGGGDPVENDGDENSDEKSEVPRVVDLQPVVIEVGGGFTVRGEAGELGEAIAGEIEKHLMFAFQRIGYDVPNMSWDDVQDMAGECKCIDTREGGVVKRLEYYHRDDRLMAVDFREVDGGIKVLVEYGE